MYNLPYKHRTRPSAFSSPVASPARPSMRHTCWSAYAAGVSPSNKLRKTDEKPMKNKESTEKPKDNVRKSNRVCLAKMNILGLENWKIHLSKNKPGAEICLIGAVFWFLCVCVCSIALVVLYTVFADPGKLTKNLIKNLAKTLAQQTKHTSGRSPSEVLFNPLHPVENPISKSRDAYIGFGTGMFPVSVRKDTVDGK